MTKVLRPPLHAISTQIQISPGMLQSNSILLLLSWKSTKCFLNNLTNTLCMLYVAKLKHKPISVDGDAQHWGVHIDQITCCKVANIAFIYSTFILVIWSVTALYMIVTHDRCGGSFFGDFSLSLIHDNCKKWLVVSVAGPWVMQWIDWCGYCNIYALSRQQYNAVEMIYHIMQTDFIFELWKINDKKLTQQTWLWWASQDIWNMKNKTTYEYDHVWGVVWDSWVWWHSLCSSVAMK